MPLKSNEISWFKPLWLRLAITAFLAVWCAWEWLWNKDAFWGWMVGAVLLYFMYTYLYAFPKEEPPHEPVQPPHSPAGDDGTGA